MPHLHEGITDVAHQGINDICEKLYDYARVNGLSRNQILDSLWGDSHPAIDKIGDCFESYSGDLDFPGDDFTDMDEN